MDRLAPPVHPSVEKLRTFGLGQLDEGEASAIEEHVSHCEACCRTLTEAGSDTFTNLLRGSRQAHLAAPATEALTMAPGSPVPVADGGRTTADSSAEPPSFDPPPELLRHPRYRVLGLLGAGGMGAVYKAEHRLMERVVALKVMTHAFVANEATVDRFRREVKAAARLAHPNIVAAYDAEQAGDVHFLVMEYVEGTDLARWLAQRGPLPVAEACDYARQCADGLQHAHEHGMIHRDIKPHNLMRARDGTVKILDFGLARLAAEAGAAPTGVTGQGILLGTVDYLAPEQADDARRADIRSDIYSLGCTLYHLLSGRPPFPKGSVVQKIMAHTEREPLSLRKLRPDLPPGLVRVVQRMMAKSPDDRYQTPEEVCDELAPFAGQTVVLDPAPRREKRAAKGKAPGVARRRRWPVAVAALLLALVGITLGAAVYRIQTDNGELVITTENPDVEVVIKQNGKVVRIIDTKTNKEVKLESGLYDLELGGQAEGLKLSLDKVTIRRGETVVATVERRPKPVAEKVGEVRRFEGHEASIQAVAFSPDGRLALSATGDDGGAEYLIRLWDVATGKEIRRLEGHTHKVWGAAFSPDGKRVLSCSEDNSVRVWDVESGKELKKLEGHDRGVLGAVFSPDGKRALSCSWDKTVRLWDLESGKELKKLEGHTDTVRRVAFSPDGRRALSGGFDTTIRLWDLETGETLKTLEGHTEKVHGVAFLPDGRRAVSCAFDGTIRLWDLESGKVIKQIAGPQQMHALALSADGRRLLTAAWDQTLRLWDVEGGKELHSFDGHAVLNAAAFSPDGRFALSGGDDRTMRLWRLPPAEAVANPPPPAKPTLLHAIPWQDESQGVPANIFQSEISSDGRLFFGAGDAGYSGAIRVFDLATGKLVQELLPTWDNGGALPCTYARFLPGSKYLMASYTTRKEMYLWDIAAGKVVGTFVGHTNAIPSFCVSPDGKRLLSWGRESDKTVRLWDIDTGKELRQLEGAAATAGGVFSPDSKQVLAFGGDKRLHLWDVESGKELEKLKDHPDACAASFSPDGKQVLSYGPDGTIRIWDLETAKEVQHFEGSKGSMAISFVAGGRLVVARSDEHGPDDWLRTWEVASGKLVGEIKYSKYGGDGWTITASPDGRLALVQVKGDASVRLLELPTGKEICRFNGCPGARSWSFSPDGTRAVAGSFRAGMYVFRLPSPPAK